MLQPTVAKPGEMIESVQERLLIQVPSSFTLLAGEPISRTPVQEVTDSLVTTRALIILDSNPEQQSL